MPKQTIAYLKGKFQTGMKPSQTDYADMFDSYVHKDDLAELEAILIDERINNYDEALKQVTAGQIDTLGDVLQVLSGFETTDDLAELLAAAGGAVTWGTVTGKPTALAVSWAEQTISVNAWQPDTPTSYEAGFGSASVVRSQLLGNIPNNKKVVIVDLFITKFVVDVKYTTMVHYVTDIAAVVIAVDPKIVLPVS
jgi:hypothetical protein